VEVQCSGVLCWILVEGGLARGVQRRSIQCLWNGAAGMSQGGSRRPYSRGGPRWHPRYKDYWDYEQNYRFVLPLSDNVISVRFHYCINVRESIDESLARHFLENLEMRL
jgi:hypothetical protein